MLRIKQSCLIALICLAPHLSAQIPGFVKGDLPKFPILAKMAELSGVIQIRMTVNNKGIVEGVSAGCMNDPSIHCKNSSLCHVASDAVRNWIFEPSEKSRDLHFYFVFQLFPPTISDQNLKPEFIAPNIYVIKDRLQIRPVMETM